MSDFQFLNHHGDFRLLHAQRSPGIYFPLVNGGNMISSVTPNLSGDCKTGQNTYLLAPASSETLHESRATRNFWICAEGFLPWSATGQSAPQQAAKFTSEEEEAVMEAGLLWQKLTRTQRCTDLQAQILSFVPAGTEKIEIMQVTVRNTGTQPRKFTPIAAIPMYGRSADNIRDHRHVTSLLQRVSLSRYGIDLHPTLTFDERGHRPGTVTYRVWGAENEGSPPVGFVPLVRDFAGSGSYDWPEAVIRHESAPILAEGGSVQGSEVIAAIYFARTELLPGEQQTYQVVLSIDDDPSAYLSAKAIEEALTYTKHWWQTQSGLKVFTGNRDFDAWIRWVGIQPVLRRICGCSFLPHHDYGRGGRGWRDLWQDSLALLLQNPKQIRSDLLAYFAGIRTDGTNATIIGINPGEFKADRNNIPRVWMDHGFWPLLTTELYLNETGDNSFLLEKQSYFRDTLAHRGEGIPLSRPGVYREGTLLEHLLIQTVTAFFDVGPNGNIRLRGADWNDGLDMAGTNGESVAFTAAYAGNFETLANRIAYLGVDSVEIALPLKQLLETPFGTPAEKASRLYAYCDEMEADSENISVSVSWLRDRLLEMGLHLKNHIRSGEWVTDGDRHGWFNSYYDDHAAAVEGRFPSGVRMMLTGQVFTLLSGTATDSQAQEIIRSADHYLYFPHRGGYCLNTDFHEVKLDMGRMFGFGYGTKENGAVFSHMAVMYAYALYSRGFTEAGWKVIQALYDQSMDYSVSRTLPGIPEYFDDRGLGMYPYLTGSASWVLLTLQTQIFGVRGENGSLRLDPQLSSFHFDAQGIAAIRCCAAGHQLTVRYLRGNGQGIASVHCLETSAVWNDSLIPAGELPKEATLEVTLI